MYKQTDRKNFSVIDQVVPAFGFYNRIGDGLAESLVNIIEACIALVARFRR